MTNDILTSEELLIKVKQGLNINGDYQDDTLSMYIDDVKSFLKIAGVSETTINSSVCVGVICRGVADLWNYGNGNTQFSEYFKMRVSQLVLNEKTTTTEAAVEKAVEEVLDTVNTELDEIIEVQKEVIDNG